jgi:very-short-patch-repair endonuclease
MGEVAAARLTEGETAAMKSYNKDNVVLARNLRKTMTFPERELWYHFLRGYPIRFQRQKPIGDYIVDFYCARAGLVVELDGPYHGIDRQMEDDAARTKALEQMGLYVLRFQNKDVVRNLYGVTLEIDRVVKERCEELGTTPQSLRDSSPDKGSSDSKH